MNLYGSTLLLAAIYVAISLFFGPTRLVLGENENDIFSPPTCPENMTSLGDIKNGGSRPTNISIAGLM